MRIDIFHPWAGLKVHGGDSPPLWSKHDLHKQVKKLNILLLTCQSLVFYLVIFIKICTNRSTLKIYIKSMKNLILLKLIQHPWWEVSDKLKCILLSIGSFSCPCNTGYTSFLAGVKWPYCNNLTKRVSDLTIIWWSSYQMIKCTGDRKSNRWDAQTLTSVIITQATLRHIVDLMPRW